MSSKETTITPSNLGQIWKSMAVSESARPDDSKTVPGSWIWPRFGWENQGRRQRIDFKVMLEIRLCLLPWLTQSNLGYF